MTGATTVIRNSLGYLSWIAAMWILAGCATAPETKPVQEEEKKDESAKGEEVEQVAPLTEEDAAQADTEKLGGQEEQVEQETQPDELSLSEETAGLLSSAIQIAGTDKEEALSLVEKAAASNPKCYQCYYNKGVLLEKQNRFTEAVDSYRKALKLKPTHLATVINLSNLYLRQKKVERARSIVTAAVKKAPKDLGLRNQLIVVLLAAGRYDDAAEQAKGVLRLDERNSEAMVHLAMTYYAKGKYELAERILLKAQQIDKASAVIPERLGFVYLKMDNMQAAIVQFKKAVEMDPNMLEAHINLGVLYNKAHDYTSAAEHFRKAIAAEPMWSDAYLDLGNALRGDRQFKEAESAYLKVLKLAPSDKRAHLNLGLMYFDDEIPGYKKSERFKKAVTHLKKFQSLGGTYPELAKLIEHAEKKHDRALKSEERRRIREAKMKKKKAEEEAKRKAQEAARLKAEQEAKRKAQEAARLKAEQEAKRKEQERKAAEKKEAQQAQPVSGGKLGGPGDEEDSGSSDIGGKLGGVGDEDENDSGVSDTGGKLGGVKDDEDTEDVGGKLGGDEK